MKLKVLAVAAAVVVIVAIISSMWTGEETIETDNQAGPGEAIEQNEE